MITDPVGPLLGMVHRPAPERVTVCPWRIGTIVAAALVLTNAERSIH
jgi:hypothetical protein